MFLAEVYRKAFNEAEKAYVQRNSVLPRYQKFFDREVLPVVEKIEAHINQDPDIKAVFRRHSKIATHRIWHGNDSYSWRFQVLFTNKRSKENLGSATLLLNSRFPEIVEFHKVTKIDTVSTKSHAGLQQIARLLISEAAQRRSAESLRSRKPSKKAGFTGPNL